MTTVHKLWQMSIMYNKCIIFVTSNIIVLLLLLKKTNVLIFTSQWRVWSCPLDVLVWPLTSASHFIVASSTSRVTFIYYITNNMLSCLLYYEEDKSTIYYIIKNRRKKFFLWHISNSLKPNIFYFKIFKNAKI